MGVYAKYLLPRIIDLAMRNRETARLRAAWIPRARDEVLEIGIGSRLNLPFYSHDVQRVYGVDPSVELQRMARKKRASEPIKLEFLVQSAENDCHSPIRASIPLWSRGHCAPFRTLPKHYSK